MTLLDDEELTANIYSILYKLGVTANSIGFFHTAYAVRLTVKQPETQLLVTKWLYPEVAKHYRSNWRAVERNIRRAVATAWKTNPEFLCEMAQHPLSCRPTSSQFLSILSAYLRTGSAA